MIFDHFTREHDKKVALLGLSSLFQVPIQNWPNSLRAGLPRILQVILQLQVMLRQQRAEFEGNSDEDDEDESDDELDDDDGSEGSQPGGNVVPEDEDVDGNPEELERLAAQAGELSWTFERGDEDDELEEDGIYTSPIDEVDEVVYFIEKFKGQ